MYKEVVRENVRKLEAYVEEMASGDTIVAPTNVQKIQEDVLKLWNVVKSQPEISEEQKNRIKALYEGVVRSLRPKRPESRTRNAGQRTRRSSSQFLRPQISNVASVSADKVPLLHLKRKVGTNWEYSSNLTGVYLDILHEIATSGTTFKDKNASLVIKQFTKEVLCDCKHVYETVTHHDIDDGEETSNSCKSQHIRYEHKIRRARRFCGRQRCS